MSIFPAECEFCGANFDDLQESIQALEDEGLCIKCRDEADLDDDDDDDDMSDEEE